MNIWLFHWSILLFHVPVSAWPCFFVLVFNILTTLPMSTFLYACETWTVTADIERRIQALKMRWFHQFLSISYRDHVTNEEVNSRIGNTIGPYEDLLTSG